ncbi:MBL fold metallo-hydrolase [Methanotorris igneus]|uniref:Beta-lactamase domain protein n=1 Tax=Methanotorris igneus (strain DSM 5666 / JCM 11834 / Kol 5) TaxID=880724 RepID=F6BCX7_METIK|nr:MBL fold metallo-hydrolase [Methanotorris igneus]AEF96338.1 beta-lactamase domain protein [Methanotorris igneus Kol 5]
MQIKILIDNIAYKRYLAQHGLSIIIEGKKRILFDTGQNPLTLKKNLEIMGEDDSFDAIVLSHGHYDHADGLFYFINKEDFNTQIIMHPDALLDKYDENKRRYIGINKEIKEFLKNYSNTLFVEEPYKLSKDIIISGYIPRKISCEMEKFYTLMDGEFKEDFVNDDMFLIVDGVVITGCSHSGIVNVIEYAKSLSKIRGVIGGFHLVNASERYINEVKEYLKNQNLEFIMPLHCTGFKAMKILSDLDNFVYGHVGKVIEI